MTKNKKSLSVFLFIATGLLITFCRLFSFAGDSNAISEDEGDGVWVTEDTSTTVEDIGEADTEDVEPIESQITTRLQPSDFSYQGAFRLPGEFDWGARGLSYFPKGDNGVGSLLVTGFEAQTADYGEVAIPTPAIEMDWQKLPMAATLRPLTNFDGTLIEDQLDPTTTFAGDIEYMPKRGSQTSDKIYGSADWWYAVEGGDFPTIWFAELDGSNPRGLFHVGEQVTPFHGNRTGDYLFTLPEWYADQYLGGRFLVTGKSRGTDTGSQGPALYAFYPWDNENPDGDLDAIPLLWYRFIYPECAGPDVGEKSACDYPDFTMCDKWVGGSFVESSGKTALILFGVKGLGSNDYGQPSTPDACNPYQGYHCDPLERQIIFYDVDELGQVALGNREAWSVVPYRIWRPGEFYLGDTDGATCGETGGMAFDPKSGRLFMVEKGLGDNNAAVVHVWNVND
jgi:hypothetical protein